MEQSTKLENYKKNEGSTSFEIKKAISKDDSELPSFARPTSASSAKKKLLKSPSKEMQKRKTISNDDDSVLKLSDVGTRPRASSVVEQEVSSKARMRSTSVTSFEEFFANKKGPFEEPQTSPLLPPSVFSHPDNQTASSFMKSKALKQKLRDKLLVRSNSADTLPMLPTEPQPPPPVKPRLAKSASAPPATPREGAKKGHIYGITVVIALSRLWSAGDQIRVYELTNGELIKEIGHTQTLALAVVGENVWSGGLDKVVYVWNSQTGEKRSEMYGHGAGIKCIAAGKTQVFTGSLDGCICIWDPATFTFISQVQVHTRAVNSMVFVGNTVWSASDDRSIRVIDAANLKIKKRLEGHSDYVKTLTTIKKRFVCSGSEDTNVVIWNAKTYTFVKRIQHARAVKSLATVNGFFLSGSSDGSLRLFNAKKDEIGNFIKFIVTSAEHPFALNSLSVVNHLVWCAFIDQSVLLWDSKKDKILATFKLGEFKNVKVPQLKKKKPKAEDLAKNEDTIMEEDTIRLLEFINGLFLRDGEEATKFNPVDTKSVSNASKAFRDGVLLSKLINKIHPNTIDLRVLNTSDPLNNQQMIENLSLCINAAKSIGCHTSIEPEYFLSDNTLEDGRVLRFIWQIVEACLFAPITNGSYALQNLVEKDENVKHLPPEEVLVRWVNHTLKENSTPVLSNFSQDVKDSVRYTMLMKSLGYSDLDKVADESDLLKRAKMVLDSASKKGCGTFIAPEDIVEGRSMMNMAFVLELFKKWSNYHEMKNMNEAMAREARSIEAWINSFGVDPAVSDVFTELGDGLVLLQVLDKIQPGVVDWKKVDKSPENKWKRMENCDYAISLIKDFGVSLKGIVGGDIEKSDPGLTLALCWQLMSNTMLKFINHLTVEGKEMTEKDLLLWANEKVGAAKPGTPGLKIESFKDTSLKSGQFLLYLLDAIKPGCINFKHACLLPEAEQTDETNIQNAKYIVSVAWKLGMQNSFILWEDIASVKPRMIELFIASVMLYEHKKRESVTKNVNIL